MDRESAVTPNLDNVLYVEQLYATYLQDPDSVPPRWQEIFREWAEGDPVTAGGSRPPFPRSSIFNPGNGIAAGEDQFRFARLQERVDQLIRNYRVRGHIIAQVDPLGTTRGEQPELDPHYYGFTEADMQRKFSTTALQGKDVQTLGELLERLRNTYCRDIGVQFMHIDDLRVREWLQERMEGTENHLKIPRDMQLRILTRLTDAVIFEEFLRKKFVGAKTFSLEGAESLIPLLDLAIEQSADHGVRQLVIGMAHRGRLNVLANIMGKNPKQIFREFEDVDPDRHRGRGDVKYHLGYSCDWETYSGKMVHVSLCFNPSHLEYVNPVALGRVRAKQDRIGDGERRKAMALLIHGDASFAGEGVVQESLNLSQLKGYRVGGALHVIVNNQIGFTTGPDEGRSTTYATDVAKMLQIPIFHVNGESPESVAQVLKLALDFHQTFRRDVVIDMYGYRRWGHNEGDEPSFTQPVLYERIAKRETVRDGYLDHLLELGEVTREEADDIADQRRALLDEALTIARKDDFAHETNAYSGVWEGYHGGKENVEDDVETAVEKETLSRVLRQLTELPEDFHLHRKLRRGFEMRKAMADESEPLDWSAAETLALGTLSLEGHPVRVTGQDSERGTFSHRHAVLHDSEDGGTYVPLAHLSPGQGPIEIYNSPLSEIGVLGFEYGYSLDCPEGLVVWEAQFGDFANAAQVIIDQFIASAEDKWRRLSGIVLLLPHGFEGQGPEHSSARLERFLMLAAEENLQIVVPSTPSQMFHALRRQVVRKWRKPLIVMTPKSLLRHPRCVSPLGELASGRFHRVVEDAEVQNESTTRVLLSSGKLYYELLEYREQNERDDVALVRIEQLYPFSEMQLESALKYYADGTPVIWVQEEPFNMGAWYYLRAKFGHRMLKRFPFSAVTRPASASPATGSANSHKREQAALIERAFTIDTSDHD